MSDIIQVIDQRPALQLATPGPPGPQGPQGEPYESAAAQAATEAAAAAALSSAESAAASAASAAESKGYATKALMDADLTPGEGVVVLVTNDATSAYNGAYRKVGSTGTGSWVQSVDRVSSIEGQTANYRAASDPLGSNSLGGYEFMVSDEHGMVVLGVRGDSTLETVGIETGAIVADSVSANDLGTPSGGLVDAVPLGYHLAVIDEDGLVLLGVKTDGTLILNDMQVTRINGVQFANLLGSGSVVTTERNYTAEVNMVLSYGQSLSTGTDSVPPITTAQRFDNLRFAGGVRSQDSATPYTGLVALIETQYSTNMGETPIGGATDMVKELILSEDALAYTDHTYQLLGSAPGAGGSPIANLVKGTSPYTRFMDDVTNGYSLALAAGKSFKAQAFFWTQGESDYINSTAAATYKSTLVALRNDLDADVKAVTGQTEPLVCISYQTQGHATYGYPNNAYIAVAQLQVAKDNPHHYVACPLYWSTQSVHQSAQNSKRLGAYYGLCYKRVVIDGVGWKPLMPIAVNRQGTIALVRFHVPHGEMVFDTVFRAAQTNMGFSLVDSGGTPIIISAVAIVGPDLVKVTAAATIPAGAKLRYGFGNGGNLRDQQGDVIVFDGAGQNFPLHNWCVIFEETL